LGEKGNACKVLVGRFEGKGQIWKSIRGKCGRLLPANLEDFWGKFGRILGQIWKIIRRKFGRLLRVNLEDY